MGKRTTQAAAAAASGGVMVGALTFTERMLAGAIARGIAQTILHPIDVARTRLQARNVASRWDARVFLKGVIPQITLALPAGAVQFAAFEAAKERLSELLPGQRLQEVRTLLAGAAGALAAASFRVPQEVLKQRVQADVYPNAAVALRETLRADGFFGLYRGWAATLSRDVPWNALSFMFHAQGKRMFCRAKGREPENDENLAIAGASGALAAVIMTPVDVVKTRLMTQAAGVQKYSGMLNTVKMIVKEEGARTLMKGVLPRIMFLAPLAGVTFSVYEGVAKIIKRRKAEGAKVEKMAALGVAFSGTPVKVARRRRYASRKKSAVASEADALCFLAAYETRQSPFFYAAS